MSTNRRTFMGGASAAAVLTTSRTSWGQKKYDDGASDTEIKIGAIPAPTVDRHRPTA